MKRAAIRVVRWFISLYIVLFFIVSQVVGAQIIHRETHWVVPNSSPMQTRHFRKTHIGVCADEFDPHGVLTTQHRSPCMSERPQPAAYWPLCYLSPKDRPIGFILMLNKKTFCCKTWFIITAANRKIITTIIKNTKKAWIKRVISSRASSNSMAFFFRYDIQNSSPKRFEEVINVKTSL